MLHFKTLHSRQEDYGQNKKKETKLNEYIFNVKVISFLPLLGFESDYMSHTEASDIYY